MAGEEAQRILGRSQRWITSSPRKFRGPIRMAMPVGFHYPCLWFSAPAGQVC